MHFLVNGSVGRITRGCVLWPVWCVHGVYRVGVGVMWEGLNNVHGVCTWWVTKEGSLPPSWVEWCACTVWMVFVQLFFFFFFFFLVMKEGGLLPSWIELCFGFFFLIFQFFFFFVVDDVLSFCCVIVGGSPFGVLFRGWGWSAKPTLW
jgi:hypothetical protein